MKKVISIFLSIKQRAIRKMYGYLYRNDNASLMPVDSESIVLLGDSQTQFFLVPRYFKNSDIKNRGVSGDRTDQVLGRLTEIVAGKPQKIFIEIGVNDLLQGVSVDATYENINSIVAGIEKESPATKIYLQNILPTNKNLQLFSNNGVYVLPYVKALNEKIHSLCIQKNINHLDLFNGFFANDGLKPDYDCGDGLHLSHKGYLRWKELIAPYM